MAQRKVVIIGAGIYGLVAAKTYLQINPDIDLTIIESDTTVGGVWSASRVHAGLIADLPSPAFELVDMSMEEEFGVPKWSDLRGTVMHQYLVRYAEKFDLMRRIRFGEQVVSVEKQGKGWSLLTRKIGCEEEIMTCDVLLLATGMNSRPKMPDLDTSAFDGLVIHSKDLHKRRVDLLSEKVRSVVVVGGNKSALEAAGLCGLNDKTVHWLIREDGVGPGMVLSSRLPNGNSNQELALRRMFSFQNPTLYGYRGWWDRFYLSGKNSYGTKLFNAVWKKLNAMSIGDRYEKSENGRLLKPVIPHIYWSPSGICIAHEDDLKFFDLVNKGETVKVARTSIKSASKNTLLLFNGTTIPVDAIIFATGWHAETSPIFSAKLNAELGFPVPKSSLSAEESKYWARLDAEADKEVMEMYPMFANVPSNLRPYTTPNTPYRQFRTIIPSKLAAEGNHNIAFLGQLGNTQHGFFAAASSLWAIAYLEGLMPEGVLGMKEDMDRKAALESAFSMRRYPGKANHIWAVLETRSWVDVMLKELGVRTDRGRVAWERKEEKGFGWWGWTSWYYEWFVAYEPSMYRGIVGEFLERVMSRSI